MNASVRACALLCLCVSAALATDGRFQIVAGEIEGAKGRQRVVIKIDTATGQTWTLISIPVSASAKYAGEVTGWVPLQEDAATEWRKLQDALDASPSAQVPVATPVPANPPRVTR